MQLRRSSSARDHPACRPDVVALSTLMALKATPERSPMDHGVATSPVTLAGWPGATAGASPASLTEMISGWLSPSTISGTANNGEPFSSVRGCLDSKSRTGSTAPATTKLIPDVSIGRRMTPPPVVPNGQQETAPPYHLRDERGRRLWITTRTP